MTSIDHNSAEWHEDMLHAFDTAADAMEAEEFGGDNADRQNMAYREVATRIRNMGKRYERRHLRKNKSKTDG